MSHPARCPAVVFLGLALSACVATGTAPPPPALVAPAPAARQTEVIELPRQTLRFKPTRDDISVGAVVFELYQPLATGAGWLDAVRVNGARPKTHTLYLRQVGRNEFELPALRIEFSPAELGGPLFLAVKAWFNELTSQQDVPYYENHLSDRYALLTYCTDENNDPAQENARWGANRAKRLADFQARLSQPLVIALNQQPLPTDGARWPMINDGFNLLNDTDRAAIQQLVRDRGERFLISVATSTARNEDRASVIVGDRDHFEGARIYNLVRANGAWRIRESAKIESGF